MNLEIKQVGKGYLSFAFQPAFGILWNASTSNWEINRSKQIIVSYNSETVELLGRKYLIVRKLRCNHTARMEEKIYRYLRWTSLTIIHFNDKWKEEGGKLKQQFIYNKQETSIMSCTCISRCVWVTWPQRRNRFNLRNSLYVKLKSIRITFISNRS